jgi:uncharacterized radical SAM protein YgiQ
VGAGNLDSMVAHYTAAKKRRSEDAYSPGKKAGLRPDRATIVYANRVREAFPDLPVIVGGLEASLRRFAHYDYWEDKVRRPILFDAKADLLIYGMGETAVREIAARLAKGESPSGLTDIRGTCFIAQNPESCAFPFVECPSWRVSWSRKTAYAEAAKIQYDEHDPIQGKAVVQRCSDRVLIVNPPAMPLQTEEFDRISELPYTRDDHPMYAFWRRSRRGGSPFFRYSQQGLFRRLQFLFLAFHQGGWSPPGATNRSSAR